MVWLTNTAKNGPEFENQALTDEYWKWRRTLTEGEPKASDYYTVAEMKAMGMIGLYKREEKKDDNIVLDMLPATMGYL